MATENPWDNVVSNLKLILIAAVTVVVGTSARGDWLLIVVSLYKSFTIVEQPTNTTQVYNERDAAPKYSFLLMIMMSLCVSFATYFAIGGWLQWNYYIKRRHEAKEWKCQPNRFLTASNERHEIMLGSLNMFIGATGSGTLATYLLNGGTSALYYTIADYGWLYLVFSTSTYFVLQEGLAYYIHRASHKPWFYKNIHKMHHRYHSPTAFSATAMHPAEFIIYQAVLVLPIFIIPIHAVAYVTLLLYSYYYGMMDHSGVKMDAFWPWQPSSIFHDDHHRYFHVNFGFNNMIFDRLHDTLRQKGRIYGEEIFGGRGKQLSK